MIRLVDVYDNPNPGQSIDFLYSLLEDRDPIANISHRRMPTVSDHIRFVHSRPYRAWYIIFSDSHPVGAVYLSKAAEIGIFILKGRQGNGYGKAAIRILMELHPQKRYLANIAPGNSRSISMFEKIGFNLIQLTLEKESP